MQVEAAPVREEPGAAFALRQPNGSVVRRRQGDSRHVQFCEPGTHLFRCQAAVWFV